MIRRPPRATRTDTLFPYTPRFRSLRPDCLLFTRGGAHLSSRVRPLSERNAPQNAAHFDDSDLDLLQIPPLAGQRTSQSARLRGRDQQPRRLQAPDLSSDERRAGKEGVSTGRSRWSPAPEKKKT